MSVDLDSSLSKLADAAKSAQNELDAHMETMKPDNMKDVFKAQQLMTKLTLTMQTMSNLHKAMSDTLKSIGQNIR